MWARHNKRGKRILPEGKKERKGERGKGLRGGLTGFSLEREAGGYTQY